MTLKDRIIELTEKGKTPIEITKELGTYSSYVYGVLSKYKIEKELRELKVTKQV
jgi:hypothetical protein